MIKFTQALILLLCISHAIVSTAQQNAQPEVVVQSGVTEMVRQAAYSRDGKFVVAAMGRLVKLWDSKTGYEIRSFSDQSSPVYSVDISGDNKKIVSGGGFLNDYKARIYDVETGEVLQYITHETTVSAVAFSPDGQFTASGDNNGKLYITEVASGKRIAEVEENSGSISRLRFSNNGLFLAVGISKRNGSPKDAVIKIVKTSSWKNANTIKTALDQLYEFYFTDDHKYAVLAAEYGDTEIIDLTKGKVVQKFNIKPGLKVTNVALNASATRLMVGYSGRGFSMYELPSRKELYSYEPYKNETYVTSLEFSKDGHFAMYGGYHDLYEDCELKKYELSNMNDLRPFAKPVTDYVVDLAYSRDGALLVSAYNNNSVKVWDTRTGKILKPFVSVTAHRATATAISNDGKIALGGHSGEVVVLDYSTGKKLYTLNSGEYETTEVTFSPDSRYLLTTNNDATLHYFDMQTGSGKELIKDGQNLNSVQFSPDGKYMAASGYYSGNTSYGFVTLYDFVNKKNIGRWNVSKDWIVEVAFSPDGKFLATASRDETIKLLTIPDFKLVKTFTGFTDNVNTVAFSPDGKTIAGGAIDKTLLVWDIQSGEVKKKLKIEGDIEKVTFSPDGKFLACGSDKVQLFRTGTYEHIVSLIAVGNTDYVAVTPQNFYSGSKGASKGVLFRIKTKIFPFDQFDLKFNRPDKVLQSIGMVSQDLIEGSNKAYQKRLKKMKFTEEMLSDEFHLPEVKILTALPEITKERKVSVDIALLDAKFKFDRLNVFINDVPIYGMAGINLKEVEQTPGTNLNHHLDLQLSSGLNKIQISVLNEKGAESLRENFEVTYNGPSSPADLHVIAIGVSEYSNANFNLTYAAKDAEDLSSYFKSNKLFNKVNAFTVTNKEATRENILKLKENLMQTGVDDQVVLFIAGHGLLDQNLDYYFATTDVDFESPAGNGLSYEAFEGLVDGIPARKKLIFIDACHSGEVDKDETTLVDDNALASTIKSRGFKKAQKTSFGLDNSFEMMKELFADLRRGSGAVVISSASGTEFAFESAEWNNGVFTYALLQGLKSKSADQDKNKEIQVSELQRYVAESVDKLTNGKQHPTVRQENMEFDFVLDKY